MSARTAGIVEVVVNVVLGLIFVHGGSAAWLWSRVERDVSWRTGPTAVGVIGYFGVFWCAWGIINLCIAPRRGAAQHEARSAAAGSFARIASYGARAVVASCVLVAVQVLFARHWLLVALATLLFATLVNAYIVREAPRRAITAFAWSGAGVALATLLIHPWFIGQPLFIVRLAIVMTIWDWLGAQLGVTPRVSRFVPSLYSGFTADHARVAR